MASYDDGRVACTDAGLIIRHYYLIRAKRISYSAIREVHLVPLGRTSKWRIHGSGDFIHWFNFDPHRPRKDTAFVIYLANRIRPVITPDDPDRVNAELVSHGVNVIIGPPAELR